MVADRRGTRRRGLHGGYGYAVRSRRHDDHCRPGGLAPGHVVAVPARLAPLDAPAGHQSSPIGKVGCPRQSVTRPNAASRRSDCHARHQGLPGQFANGFSSSTSNTPLPFDNQIGSRPDRLLYCRLVGRKSRLSCRTVSARVTRTDLRGLARRTRMREAFRPLAQVGRPIR